MAYNVVLIGKDPSNRLIDLCPGHGVCPDDCPLCDKIRLTSAVGCSNCFNGARVPPDGPYELGPTDAAEIYVFTFDSKSTAQAWMDSWPSPVQAFRGKLVYGFEANFVQPQEPAS
jgi:hypothetical protein